MRGANRILGLRPAATNVLAFSLGKFPVLTWIAVERKKERQVNDANDSGKSEICAPAGFDEDKTEKRDADSGREFRHGIEHCGGETALGPQAIAFSPGGSILASVAGTDQIALWNATDPAHAYRMATLGGAGDFIVAFAFSPGGNLLAAVTYHGAVLVYSLADPARPARTATVRGLLTRALYPNGTPQPAETPLCATCGPANYAVAFSPGGHTLTVVVDRAEMSANSGRDTIFDWPVTGSGTLGTGTVAARDVADFQPVIAPGDRFVLGSPGNSHAGRAWRAWPLP